MVRYDKLNADEIRTILNAKKAENAKQWSKAIETSKFARLQYKEPDFKKLFEPKEILKESIEKCTFYDPFNSFERQKMEEEEEFRLKCDSKEQSPDINDLKEFSEIQTTKLKMNLLEASRHQFDEESKVASTVLDELVVTNSVLRHEKKLKQLQISDEKELELKHLKCVKMFEKYHSPPPQSMPSSSTNLRKLATEQVKPSSVQEDLVKKTKVDIGNDPIFKEIEQIERCIFNYEKEFRTLFDQLIRLNKIDECKNEIELCEASIDRINELVESPPIGKLKVIARFSPNDYQQSSHQLLENLKSLDRDYLNKIRQINAKYTHLRQAIMEEEKRNRERKEKLLNELFQFVQKLHDIIDTINKLSESIRRNKLNLAQDLEDLDNICKGIEKDENSLSQLANNKDRVEKLTDTDINNLINNFENIHKKYANEIKGYENKVNEEIKKVELRRQEELRQQQLQQQQLQQQQLQKQQLQQQQQLQQLKAAQQIPVVPVQHPVLQC